MNDLSGTERCVKCGLCLPHCPTFILTGNEADSPRGRISLMQSMQQNPTDLSPGLFRHLDQCLQCQACEAMCPSQVPFEALMDTARAQLESHRQRGMINRLTRNLGLHLITSSTAQRLAAAGLSGIQTLRLDKLLATLPITPRHIKRGLRLIPGRQPRRFKRTATEKSSTVPVQRVQLFTGCTGDLFDRTTVNATQRLLDRLGCAVDIPTAQTCCGALHQHNGEPDKASQLAQTNIGAFPGPDPVITVASGCQARLKSYLTDQPEAADFNDRIIDILSFLLARGNSGLEFRPVKATLALHIPCTQRNALKQAGTAAQVLAWIPGLNIIDLNPNGGCCGAAGSYMLSQPQLSEPLGQQMADAFIASGAQQLVTTNIGCALQLRAALRERGTDVEVLHPVTLIERALR
jgi:glycolate oxidase iron-sulfur subunit